MRNYRIDLIFGGFFVLAALAAGFLLFLKSGVMANSGKNSGVVVISSNVSKCDARTDNRVVLVGEPNADFCTCYEQAYACGAKDISLNSTQYETGYSACRISLGNDGGRAWQTGWSLGTAKKRSQAKCQYFMNTYVE